MEASMLGLCQDAQLLSDGEKKFFSQTRSRPVAVDRDGIPLH